MRSSLARLRTTSAVRFSPCLVRPSDRVAPTVGARSALLEVVGGGLEPVDGGLGEQWVGQTGDEADLLRVALGSSAFATGVTPWACGGSHAEHGAPPGG